MVTSTPRTSEPQHFGDVGVFEKELAGSLVVFLIEGAAGDEDSDGHWRCAVRGEMSGSMSRGQSSGVYLLLTNQDERAIIRRMLGDLKLALRLLAKSRGFTAVAMVTLAVTIGVNSAIFSLIEGALLRPAVPHKPEEVVCIFTGSRDAKRSFRQFSYAEFEALREANSVFTDVAAVNFNYVSLGGEMELRRTFAFMVSDNYFQLMGGNRWPAVFLARRKRGRMRASAWWWRVMLSGSVRVAGRISWAASW